MVPARVAPNYSNDIIPAKLASFCQPVCAVRNIGGLAGRLAEEGLEDAEHLQVHVPLEGDDGGRKLLG